MAVNGIFKFNNHAGSMAILAKAAKDGRMRKIREERDFNNGDSATDRGAVQCIEVQ